MNKTTTPRSSKTLAIIATLAALLATSACGDQEIGRAHV